MLPLNPLSVGSNITLSLKLGFFKYLIQSFCVKTVNGKVVVKLFVIVITGLTFEMFIPEDLTDILLEILSGEIEMSLENGSVYHLKYGNTIQVL